MTSETASLIPITNLDNTQSARSARSILTRFAIVAFIVVGLVLTAGKLAVDAVIEGVDVADQRDDLARSRVAFDRLASRAQQQVEDYAFWDETVRLAQNPAAPGATGFFRREFVEWLPRNDYEFIQLLDAKRASAFEWTASKQVHRPAELTRAPFLNYLARQGSLGGYVRDGNELYLVAGSAVHPSKRSGADSAAVRGYLVVGGTLHGDLIAAVERDLQLKIRILPSDTKIPDTPMHAEYFANDDSVRMLFHLTGLNAQPAAVVAVLDTRVQQHRFSSCTKIGEIAGLTLCAAAFFLVWLYGRRLLITPLSDIALEVVAMHGRGELTTITSPAPSEEWALFLSTFNETVQSLREAAARDREVREALAQSQKMAAVGSLAGGIAHDFNNLMGAVLAGVRVARVTLNEDRRGAAALDAIEHAGRRAAELTKQLLGISRHEPLVKKPVDLVAAVSNIQGMCASIFDRRIRVHVDVAPHLPAVDGDPGQIEQALLNLCINARDAMPEGGNLRIGARLELVSKHAAHSIRDIQPGSFVVLSVSDDGTGMTDDVKRRIFEPFFTTKGAGKGTGLGLAMVYGLAHSSGGTIVVDSALGVGTRFDMYLPASNVPAEVTAPRVSGAIPIPGRSNGDRPAIIIADDETGLREMLALVLEHEGYNVIEASNGKQALDRFAAHKGEIAAVLLDVQMPVMGGLEAYARIRAMSPDTPVMLGTGYVGDAALTAMREAGADDMLLKPYEMRDLLDRLAKVCGARV